MHCAGIRGAVVCIVTRAIAMARRGAPMCFVQHASGSVFRSAYGGHERLIAQRARQRLLHVRLTTVPYACLESAFA